MKASPQKQQPINERVIINRLSAVGIGGNIALSAFKFVAGIVGSSSAMVSDAVHSLSDVVATFIALIGTKASMREADANHPYGHERIECLAAMALGLILVVTGLGIGEVALSRIMAGDYAALPVPGMIALVAAVISIVAKEAMFRYTRYYAKLIGSSAFEADAWHHRSDALSSVGALVGIGGSMLGYPVLDAVASLVICAFILKAAYDIMVDAVRKLLDTSCDAEFEQQIYKLAESQEGVKRVDLLHTRMFGSKVYVDLEIAADGTLSLQEAHSIAQRVHDEIEAAFPTVKHVMIHVNPA